MQIKTWLFFCNNTCTAIKKSNSDNEIKLDGMQFFVCKLGRRKFSLPKYGIDGRNSSRHDKPRIYPYCPLSANPSTFSVLSREPQFWLEQSKICRKNSLWIHNLYLKNLCLESVEETFAHSIIECYRPCEAVFKVKGSCRNYTKAAFIDKKTNQSFFCRSKFSLA